MPEFVHCDQCGCKLSEEDFRTGGAFRDRADVFCPKCYVMYQEDELRRDRERKRRHSAAAIEARTTARGRSLSSRRTEAIPRKGTPRRGATRAIAAARRSASGGRSGRAGARREPQGRGRTVALIVLAVAVAFAAALGIRHFMSKKAPTSRDAAPQAPVLQAPDTPDAPVQKAPASAPKEAEKDPERDERVFGRSLFGPGGDLERRGDR